jgi:hypothetical protein
VTKENTHWVNIHSHNSKNNHPKGLKGIGVDLILDGKKFNTQTFIYCAWNNKIKTQKKLNQDKSSN